MTKPSAKIAKKKPPKVRKIIVLSDGTGNAVGKVWRTNVWRLYEALDLSGDDQVARYDDGVGSSSFLPTAMIGGAFGFGLKRNVIDLYKFISRNANDHGVENVELYFFGFSRGAFTVRVLAGLILSQGLLPADKPEEIDRRAKWAYNQYRSKCYSGRQSIWRLIQFFSRAYRSVTGRRPEYKTPEYRPDIQFIGVWDTVGAYGFPFHGMSEAFDQFIWPIKIPTEILSTKVKYAAHALSLDDERTTFHPILFSEADDKFVEHQRIKQVWFAGVHANVGGGYPDDSLAQISLRWMMSQAKGLRFKKPRKSDHDAVKKAQSSSDKDGRHYDSRSGFGAFYRYGPRDAEQMCKYGVGYRRYVGTPLIHHSVFNRIKQGGNNYSPISLPTTKYKIIDHKNRIIERANFKNAESDSDIKRRKEYDHRLKSLIFWRTSAYFGFLFSALALAFLPFVADSYSAPIDEVDTRWGWRWLLIVLQLVEYLAPSFLDEWPRFYAESPWTFLGLSLPFGAFAYLGARLKAKITDEFSQVWRDQAKAPKRSFWDKLAHEILKNAAVQSIGRIFGGRVIPILFVCMLACMAVAVLNRAAIYVADGFGEYCSSEGPYKAPKIELSELGAGANIVGKLVLPVLGVAFNESNIEKTLEDANIKAVHFKTESLCFATGLQMKQGHRYRLHLKIQKPLTAGRSTFGLEGVQSTSWGLFSKPFRRSFFDQWDIPIARIGDHGSDEYPLKPNERTKGILSNLQKEFVARTDGELFFYMNKALFGWPNRFGLFAHSKNEGTIYVCVEDLTETRSKRTAEKDKASLTTIGRQLLISFACGNSSVPIPPLLPRGD
jgi:uncharacterized protein (DUF2235 family)